MHSEDTICAISTAPGIGAIANVRMSGNRSVEIAENIFKPANTKHTIKLHEPNTVVYGSVYVNSKKLDNALVSVFKAPRSYTGEDIVEFSVHGSPYIQQKIMEELIEKGARLATPGEFTMRAFMNGKLDLSQAEAVADLIASNSEAEHRIAMKQMRGGFSSELNNLKNELLGLISLIELELDFSEEDVEFADREQLYRIADKIERLLRKLIQSFSYGNAIKKGIPVAIIGRTNAGKSTLLNQLLREEKAIVSEVAGTTRDFIEDTLVLEGINFRFIDTAGLRKTKDSIEIIGIERTLKKYREADIILVLINAEDRWTDINESLQNIKNEPAENKKIIYVINKIDHVMNPKALENDMRKKIDIDGDFISISAKYGKNINKLEEKLVSIATKNMPCESDVIVSNVRHFEALKKSHEAIERVIEGMDNSLSGDFLAQDIREVLHYLGEITGEITTDEILGNIFKNFCIGK